MSGEQKTPKPPFIRELRDRYKDRGAVILGKGPSLDVWWDRGGCSDRDSWLVFAVNENVLIPDLAPDYWFWAGPEHARHVEDHGGVPDGTTQVFIEFLFQEEPEYAAERAQAYPSLLYMRGTDADGDPWAVPGLGFAPTAAFFCAAVWGCREVLAVGFDGLDEPKMKTYANCIPWLIFPKHIDHSFSMNNRSYLGVIKRFDLPVTWYHRNLTAEEITAAHEKFATPPG